MRAQMPAQQRTRLSSSFPGRFTNSAIADRLIITLRSAEKIVGSIFQKLGLESTPDDHRRVLAVLKFMRSQSGSNDALDAINEA